MATLSKQGREIGRINQLRASYSLRDNGRILKNEGDGWKILKLRDGWETHTAWAHLCAKEAELSPEFKAYRRAVQSEFCLANRWKYLELVKLLGDDIDGIWAHLDDEGMHVDLETLRELNALRQAIPRRVKQPETVGQA